jgi:hypothetical protein
MTIEEKTKNIKSFLANFPNHKIQYLPDSDLPGMPTAKVSEIFRIDEAETMQAQFHGVFFSVNGFNQRRVKKDLVSVNAYFVDLDIKKEVDVISPEKYKELKTRALNKLTGAILQPHYITETKNGYQAIWLISDQPDEAEYIRIEKELISYFEADPGGTSVTKVLRLPNFYHLKNPNDPFLCKLVLNNFKNPKYTTDRIVEKFKLSLPEKKVEPQQPASASVFAVPIKSVVEKTANMIGIKINYKNNTDGSLQIIENGEITSGFISSQGDFVSSASGKDRQGNHLGIAKYYLNKVGNKNYSTQELIKIIRNIEKIQNQPAINEVNISDHILEYGALLSMKLNDIGFIIDDLIPATGITMLQGHPDAHKSWLALYFTFCIITGNKVFGVHSVKQINILIVNVDDDLPIIRSRLKKLGLTEDHSYKLYIWSKAGFDILAYGEQLKKITKEKNIAFIIFDTFRDIHDSDENASQEMSKVMKVLKEIATNCSILLIHHQNKDGKNGLLSGRGSTVITGSLISLLSAQRYEKDNVMQIKQLKNKLREKVKPFAVRLIDEGNQLKFILIKSKKEIPLEEVSSTIEEEIKKTGSHFFKKELLEKVKKETNYTSTSIDKAFETLEKNNVIEKDSKKYQYNKIGYRLVSSKSNSLQPQPP